jgi:energy-coupling factor transporter ATP-binding protein EcfA2
VALLRVEGVHWRYEGAQEETLRGVDLAVERGEFLAIMGRTGAGKSTLCRCLNGLIPRRARGLMTGRVWVGDMDTQVADFYALTGRVGMVFQDPETQFIMMAVEDEIALGLENRGWGPAEIRRRILAAMEEVGLNLTYLGKAPTDLSGGEKQRVAIAMILALEPEVVVLDEPTSDLDPVGRRAVFEVLRRLRLERETTVVLVSHESEEVARCADRVAVLEEGRLASIGSTGEVLQRVERLREMGVHPPQVTELFHALGERELPLTVEEVGGERWLSPNFGREEGGQRRGERESEVVVEGLHHTYPDGTVALRGVSLTVHEGDYLAVVGSNGSGKTTLVKHFNGLLRPSAGRVLIGGLDTRRASTSVLARRMGYCFQNPDHQLFCQTVAEEVAFGPRNLGLDEATVQERVTSVLETVGLAGYRDEHPFFLGKGQRQRLAAAAALAVQPAVMVVDEPTTGQDREMSQEIIGLLDRLNQAGHTVVVITHDMRLVAEHCQRVVVMAGGQILTEGPPRQVFAQPDLLAQADLQAPPVVRLSLALWGEGSPPALTIAEMVQRLSQTGHFI